MNVILFTLVTDPAELGAARLLIASLRTFGGVMKDCPVRVFVPAELVDSAGRLTAPDVELIPLTVPPHLADYPFGSKVLACARAEVLCPAGTDTLLWMDPNCLVLQPPVLYDLGAQYDVALRPVHIRNVGLGSAEPPDVFWGGIDAALGIPGVCLSVESFVDRQQLRAYFNSHALAVSPALGLMRDWLALYEKLLADSAFQTAACPDPLHRIFLFQALFSTLVTARIPTERIHILPLQYNYPYHLQARIPLQNRAAALNDLVTVAYEDLPFRLADVKGFEVNEPLRGWLARFTEVF